MSTRAHILIKDREEQFKLYHHWDGYPEGVGKDLKRFLSMYYKDCRWDAEIIANNLVKGELKDSANNSDNAYEITSCIHGDEEYVYVIDCKSKTIKCYKHGWDEGKACIKPENEVEIPELNGEEE